MNNTAKDDSSETSKLVPFSELWKLLALPSPEALRAQRQRDKDKKRHLYVALPVVKLGPRRIFVRRDDLNNYLDSLSEPFTVEAEGETSCL